MPNIKNEQQESGIVAILVVVTFTAVLALIALGFSQLMSREERQALDRQLSLQSYYAAESGLNDARTYLKNPAATNSTGCLPPNSVNPSPFVLNGNISGDTGSTVKYSCVSIDPTPNEVYYKINPGESKVIKLDVPGMDKIYLSWENQNPPAGGGRQPLGSFVSQPDLPRADQVPSDGTGLLRTGIYPIKRNTGVVANANAVLQAASRNYFLYPDAGSGTMTANNQVNFTNAVSGVNGRFVHGNCNNNTHPTTSFPNSKVTPRYCNSEIYSLDGGTNTYTLNLTAFYEPIIVAIQVAQGNTSLAIPNVEGIVDITGAGNDVLSRIQARIPLVNDANPVSYGIQSMQAICKVFKTDVINSNLYGSSNLDPSVSNADGACLAPQGSGPITGGGIPPLGNVPCGTNAVGSYPNCSCPAGYSPNPDPFTDCKQNLPPPPTCSVGVSGQRNGDGTITVSAQAGGCQYYWNNVVGWNGGGQWTVPSPSNPFNFCQKGGSDPYGFTTENCTGNF